MWCGILYTIARCKYSYGYDMIKYSMKQYDMIWMLCYNIWRFSHHCLIPLDRPCIVFALSWKAGVLGRVSLPFHRLCTALGKYKHTEFTDVEFTSCHNITLTSQWAPGRPKWPVTRLFVLPCIRKYQSPSYWPFVRGMIPFTKCQ